MKINFLTKICCYELFLFEHSFQWLINQMNSNYISVQFKIFKTRRFIFKTIKTETQIRCAKFACFYLSLLFMQPLLFPVYSCRLHDSCLLHSCMCIQLCLRLYAFHILHYCSSLQWTTNHN